MITVENLGISFGETDPWVFRNLDLKVQAQECVVILGPSGSGKSVLLKTIAGLLTPTEGKVEVASSQLGMLFQKNALFDSLTCESNLLFPLRERLGIEGKEARLKAQFWLNAVGLGGCQKLYPDEISGGMQKRLGIARALIVQPEVILYDEPTAGLDPITSKLIAELIQDLRKTTRSTAVVVTNDVQRAYQLGDRIFLLAQGKLLGGLPAELLKKTEDPRVRQFIYGQKIGPLTSKDHEDLL